MIKFGIRQSFDNIEQIEERYHDSTKAYELFVDIGEAPLQYPPCEDEIEEDEA